MDEKDTGTDGRANVDEPTRGRRAAVAYLDLWERHVVHAAVHGPVLAVPPPRPNG
jgi:hypothetical protein